MPATPLALGGQAAGGGIDLLGQAAGGDGFLASLNPEVRRYKKELAAAKDEQAQLNAELAELPKGSQEYAAVAAKAAKAGQAVKTTTEALNKQLAAVGKQSKALGIAGKAFGLATGFIVGMGAALLVSAVRMGDAAAQTLALGATSAHTAEELARLEAGFDNLGVKVSAVDLAGFEKAQRRVNAALRYSGQLSTETVIAYSMLGLAVGEQVKLDEQRYNTLRRMTLTEREWVAQQTGVAQGVLDAIALGYTWQDAQQSGIALTEEQMRQQLETRKSVKELMREYKLLGQSIATELLPYAKAFSEWLIPAVKNVTEWVKANPKLVRGIFAFGIALAGIVAVLSLVAGLAVTLAAVSGVGLPLAATAVALGAGVAAVGGAGFAVSYKALGSAQKAVGGIEEANIAAGREAADATRESGKEIVNTMQARADAAAYQQNLLEPVFRPRATAVTTPAAPVGNALDMHASTMADLGGNLETWAAGGKRPGRFHPDELLASGLAQGIVEPSTTVIRTPDLIDERRGRSRGISQGDSAVGDAIIGGIGDFFTGLGRGEYQSAPASATGNRRDRARQTTAAAQAPAAIDITMPLGKPDMPLGKPDMPLGKPDITMPEAIPPAAIVNMPDMPLGKPPAVNMPALEAAIPPAASSTVNNYNVTNNYNDNSEFSVSNEFNNDDYAAQTANEVTEGALQLAEAQASYP